MKTVAEKASFTLLAAGSVFFSWSIAGNGIPALRQDWHWPISRSGLIDWLVNCTSGWRLDGIGNLNAYPTEYLYGAASSLVGLVMGPWLGLAFFLVGVGLLAAWGVYEFCRTSNVSAVVRIGASLILLFNPWTYTEVVAGHLFMVVSAFGVLVLASGWASSSARGRWLRLVGVIFVSAQLQFIILALPFVAWHARRNRDARPLALAALLLSPLALGILSNLGSVARIAFLPKWEFQQSIGVFNALQLTGYFTGYDAPMIAVARFGVIALVVVCLISSVISRRPEIFPWAVSACILLVMVTGEKGPLAIPFTWAIRHAPVVGLFRELYDELGLLLVAMVAITLIGLRNMRAASAMPTVILTSGIVMLASWIIAPPSTQTVSGNSIEQTGVAIPKNSRFLLLPPFQPLAYLGRGAGVDPGAISFIGNRTPINEYIPRYPENAASQIFARNGNLSRLKALGVAAIYARTGYSEIANAENPYTVKFSAISRPKILYVHSDSELERLHVPPCATIASDYRRPAIFFADGCGPWRVKVISPTDFLNARDRWVSAAFTFLRRPYGAQFLGGVATTGTEPYRLPKTNNLLVYVRGQLFLGKRLIAKNDGQFGWIRVRGLSGSLRCRGYCELLATSEKVPKFAAQGRRTRSYPVAFNRFLPWLLTARLPRERGGFLLYRERYNSWWLAVDGWSAARHVRVNGIFNGWYLPPHGSGEVIIFEGIAALQALMVLLAWLAVGGVCTAGILGRSRLKNAVN